MTKLLLVLLLCGPAFAQDSQIPVTEVETVDPFADPAAPEPAVSEPVTPAPVVEVAPALEAPPAKPVPDSTSPVLTTEAEMDDDEKRFNPLESHWVSIFGFETLQYSVPYEFTGEKKSFRPGGNELWGGRLGFGGELYLGLGFTTTSRLEGYYVGTLFSRVLNAGPEDEDVEFAYTKRSGSLWGVEATQSLGIVFDFKTKNPILDEWSYLTMEPFVEAGIGRAYAYNRLNYDYNTGSTTNEGYRQRVRDDLWTTKFGGGINFTSSSGYFLYLKATVNSFDVFQRKLRTYTREDQGTGSTVRETLKDVKLDPITTYALGGGYKF